MKDLRQTGRTTRMLIDAVSCAREGKAVYVIAATHLEKKRMQRLLWELTDDQCCHGIKVETPSSVRLCWESFTLIGAHPNCVVLVDHFAIEQEFATLLNQLHRYD